MKIYTRKGDSGQTSIWGGRRLSKDRARMEAIGTVDECNAVVGSALATELPEPLSSILQTVQGRLFVVGSELMAPDRTGAGRPLPRFAGGDVPHRPRPARTGRARARHRRRAAGTR